MFSGKNDNLGRPAGCGSTGCADCRRERSDERVRVSSFSGHEELPQLPESLRSQVERQVGTVVVVPKGVQVDSPLILSACLAEGETVVVVLEEGAGLTLLDTVRCGCGTGPQVQRLVLLVGIGAELRLAELRCLADEQSFAGEIWADVSADGRLELFSGLLGGGQVESRSEIFLSGSGAAVKRVGLSFVTGKGRQEVRDSVRHFSDRTTSYIMTRGVLDGRASVERQPLIEIRPGTVGCEGRQDCRELSLSGDARAEIVPSLEIGSEDVTCSHGASFSQPDPTAVFYLTSRGLAPETARQQVALGFFRPALEQVWDGATRDSVRGMIVSRLGCRTETGNE